MTTAIYPGSFDPITNGHLDVVQRAARIFEKVIIGVYDTPEKKLMFSPQERVELARAAVISTRNVEVQLYSGLTVAFAKMVGALVMVRGLRASADFEFEFDLAMMTNKLLPELEMVCFMASSQYQFLSSSLLKEVARLGGKIDDWVTADVAFAVKNKVKNVPSIKEY
ncbi:MAG: pantetheine-phosphate adenylyltransferase [Dehalococcoidia bacterium]|nr:pantetheine-phosphate adenylyltransferase [Dehalococcoidia bacterium]